MNAWIVPVLASLSTLLLVSITYITVSLRHKQRMTLIEKGLSPDYFKEDDQIGWQRIGLLLVGAGLGFLTAFLIDRYAFHMENGTEPLYPSLTAIGAGLALIVNRITSKRNRS